MKLFPDSKVYMICPANIHSGGPELCHQLVSQLIQLGVDAYIFYTGGNSDNPVDDFYVKYHAPYVREIEDKPHNVLILTETANWAYFRYRRVKKIFWWMSVDNYIADISNMIRKHADNALAEPMPRFFYFDADSTEHWVQSEYARQFVELNGIPRKQIRTVGDYLNQTFLIRANKVKLIKKENVVAFNPRKGINVTLNLRFMATDIDWRPIENMTPEQVQELLARAKVYIDFGNHPGKDRIPREAALSDCVIITGKRGSAANSVDINIPAEFKFDEADLPAVIDKIRDVFDNYRDNLDKQNGYRARILDDKKRFAREVATAFSIDTKKIPAAIAIAQGLTDKGIALTEHFASRNVNPEFILDDRFCGENGLDLHNLERVNNSNFFYPKSGGGRIQVISASDAKFLYWEGRLRKFALLNPTEAEIATITEMFKPAPEDILAVNIET